MSAKFFWVEFVGGPFDGHVQAFPRAPENLVKTVAFPINANTLLVLNGEPSGPRVATTSVAFYELCETNHIWWYHFLGAKSTEECRQMLDARTQ
jgi:hypothetical protein